MAEMHRETFHEHYSEAHPVRYSSQSGHEPDRWLSLNDAVHRLHRVLDIPHGQEFRYDFARRLRAGATIPTMFASYSIDQPTADGRTVGPEV